MQELLEFILEINTSTKYTATLRYTPRKYSDGVLLDDFAVDLIFGEQNIYHKHTTNIKSIPSIIEDLKQCMQTQSTYYVRFSDGYMNINYKATSLRDAQRKAEEFVYSYGITCRIEEVLNENM